MSPRACFSAALLSLLVYGSVFAIVIGVRHTRQHLERGTLFPTHVGTVAP